MESIKTNKRGKSWRKGGEMLKNERGRRCMKRSKLVMRKKITAKIIYLERRKREKIVQLKIEKNHDSESSYKESLYEERHCYKTGNKKCVAAIPKVVEWLNTCMDKSESEGDFQSYAKRYRRKQVKKYICKKSPTEPSCVAVSTSLSDWRSNMVTEDDKDKEIKGEKEKTASSVGKMIKNAKKAILKCFSKFVLCGTTTKTEKPSIGGNARRNQCIKETKDRRGMLNFNDFGVGRKLFETTTPKNKN